MVHKFVWKITEGRIFPDGYPIKSILINDRFPGPQINAVTGDRIVVMVRNRLHRGFTIHWHGIKQMNNAKMDGVPHITQMPIRHRHYFIYNFTLDNSGTFWYHAHTGMDAEQAFGALIVRDPRETWQSVVDYNSAYYYHSEHTLLLTEWWHKTPEEARRQVTQLPFSAGEAAASNLINGRCLNHTDGPHVIKVERGKTYRLRLIGATGMSMFNFRIQNHKFTVIEVEGTLVEPVTVYHIDINSGERYSVLLHANQPIDSYVGSISTPFEAGANNGVFVLKYAGSKIRPITRGLLPATRATRFIESQLRPSKWYSHHLTNHYYPPPKSIDREIFLSTHLNHVNGLPIHTMNEVKPAPKRGVLLKKIYGPHYQPTNVSHDVYEGENVQIVIEDLVYKGRRCPIHPWHLHGHSFHVVANGHGFYNPRLDRPKIQAKLNDPNFKPILRDTFTLYTDDVTSEEKFMGQVTPTSPRIRSSIRSTSYSIKNQKYRSCGWYALRFKADNPGSWMFHCHISHHMLMGMATTINVLPKSKFQTPT
ncbi:hypothetical protein L0F63_002339 [Massospora cicadina]|nr:hypothetical protein L0F63_002339 [Massospora cicadina]